jgi:uncharacterized membrane protein YdjX (TVP38/TMEM64 family)
MGKQVHLTHQAATDGNPGRREAQPGRDSSPLAGILTSVLLVACVIGALLYLDAREQVLLLLNWIEGQGPWGPVLFITVMAVVVVLLLPGVFFTMGAGFVFGVTQGTLYVVAGTTLGATLSFLIARHLLGARAAHYLLASPRLGLIGSEFARHGWKVVLLTRLIPFFPFKLSNYVFGLGRFSLPGFMLGTVIGIVPFSLNNVYLGSIAADIAMLGLRDAQRTPLEWTVYGLGFLAVVVSLFYFNRLAGNALAQYRAETPQEAG